MLSRVALRTGLNVVKSGFRVARKYGANVAKDAAADLVYEGVTGRQSPMTGRLNLASVGAAALMAGIDRVNVNNNFGASNRAHSIGIRIAMQIHDRISSPALNNINEPKHRSNSAPAVMQTTGGYDRSRDLSRGFFSSMSSPKSEGSLEGLDKANDSKSTSRPKRR